ncbi:DUF1493 family protein [Flavobacterium koreense]
MILEEEIINFIEKEFWESNLNSNSDIFEETGFSGDDCDDLMTTYQKKYQVDMSEYLWYFHHEEEGSWNSFGGSFCKSPNERVTRIPITPKMLTEFANSKKWTIDYPEHKLSKYRYDILINWVLIISIIVIIILVKI